MASDADGNVIRNESFKQVVIWPGTACGASKAADFEKFILDELRTRCQYLEEIRTNRGFGDDDSGGRNDIFFAVHDEDIAQFSVPRFAFGMRWIEDIYAGGSGYLYPVRCEKYKTWDGGQSGASATDEDEVEA